MKEKSKCCKAPVKVGGDDEEGTHYYICNKCGQPTDLNEIIHEAKKSQESLEEQQIEEFKEKFGSDYIDRPMPSGMETENKIISFLQKCQKELKEKYLDEGLQTRMDYNDPELIAKITEKVRQDERQKLTEKIPKNYLEWKQNKGIMAGTITAQAEVDEVLKDVLNLLNS